MTSAFAHDPRPTDQIFRDTPTGLVSPEQQLEFDFSFAAEVTEDVTLKMRRAMLDVRRLEKAVREADADLAAASEHARKMTHLLSLARCDYTTLAEEFGNRLVDAS